MKEGTYRVKTTQHTYIMTITHYDTIYTLRYGDALNHEGPCIELTYDTSKPHVLKLDNIEYRGSCTEDKDMIRGEGTRDMLKSILRICIDSFPNIKRVVFNDVATFTCQDNKQVIMSYYSLLLYGETWYERHFQAKAKDKNMREKLNIFKTLLSQPPKPGLFSFTPPPTTPTWHHYFIYIKNKDGCAFFHKHKDIIERASRVKLMYSEWYISTTKIKSYSVNIKYIKKLQHHKTIFGGRKSGGILTMEDI